MTPSEVYFANRFAVEISKNNKIDNKDFYDCRNATRTEQKVFEDNLRGKLAELHICNIIGSCGLTCQMDFNIYRNGIGDDFDIIVNNKAIDVKASTPRAKCLMVEVTKFKRWMDTKKHPDFLCMVSVEPYEEKWTTEYMFGIDWHTFLTKAKLYRRGDNIPNTVVQLKAANVIVTSDNCCGVDELLDFMKKEKNDE